MECGPRIRVLWIAVALLLVGGATGKVQAQLDNLTATTTATTVRLDWTADPSGTDVVGYNVYRKRTEGGSYFQPSAYTGVRDAGAGTRYTDTKLASGQTYFYKIRARTRQLDETGPAREIRVQTKPSSATAGTYTYANLKVGVVIYQDAYHRDGGIHQTSDRVVEDVKFYLDQAKDFYWRNSGMKLNLQFTYYPIEQRKEFGDAGAFKSMLLTADHLEKEFGVVNSQYDLIFRITPSIGGFWSWGTKDMMRTGGREHGFTEGRSRDTGFSHLQWPMREHGFEKYPAQFGDRVSREINQLIWLFIHEAQHAVDAIYKDNGHPEMGHGDHPEEFTRGDRYPNLPDSLRFGKRYDFQSALLRAFGREDGTAYEALGSLWGDVYRVRDADEDGFPDRDSVVVLDEARFGTRTQTADTDGDRYTDKAEATDGLYVYSATDPNAADTDGDGVVDGADPHPRYDLDPTVPKAGGFRPVVDGSTNEWPDKTQISRGVFTMTEEARGLNPTVYATYFRDSLYVALDLPEYAVPTFRFDFGADGRWFGGGNTEVRADVQGERIDRLRTWDARPVVRQYQQSITDRDRRSPAGMWDSDSKYRDRFDPVFHFSNTRVELQNDDGHVQVELAFPRRPRAGLSLESGTDIGFWLSYDDVRSQSDGFATTFDKWSYVYLTLGKTRVEERRPADETALTRTFPNPYSGDGPLIVEYSAAERGDVRIGLYDVLGRRVQILKEGPTRLGRAVRLRWDGTKGGGQPVASGVYFLRLTKPNGGVDSQRIVIVR